MASYKKDYIFYGIVILFAIFFLAATTQIHSANNTATLGPKFWPMMILIMMLVFAFMGIIKTFITHKRIVNGNMTWTEESEEPERRLFNIPLSLISMSSIMLYALGIFFIGFILSTIIFLFVLIQLLGGKKKLLLLILSIVITGVCVLLFSNVLSIPLPRGIGIFRELSFLFY
ncbi:tripartite tricarboxylate transporter TctB family protein [Oceanobacillus sp. CFH 90083]|uniref:tripartite tricarboxylate transporter TctB family protein n=1 Tax=Oceanobacillus sp. CFH 90083 TaxID=2592336 RepID=UPI00128C3FFE|nr:tripartite tricarboxylate transporter TctB family protein [Oceanobacillus sp. CFH 90083]